MYTVQTKCNSASGTVHYIHVPHAMYITYKLTYMEPYSWHSIKFKIRCLISATS